MQNTFGFVVNAGQEDESYIEVVDYGDYVAVGDGKTQFAFTPDEWVAFTNKFANIVRYLNAGK